MSTDWTSPADAAAHFAYRLSVGTDVGDVEEALASGDPGFVLVDSRSREAGGTPATCPARYTCPAGRSPSAPRRSWTAPSPS